MKGEYYMSNKLKKESDKDTNIEVKVKITTLTKWLCILGIIMLIFANISFPSEWSSLWWFDMLLKVFNIVGSTSLSAGAVSLIVETSTIKGIVSNSIKQLMNCDFPIRSYSNEVLAKLKKRIAAQMAEKEIQGERLLETPYCYEQFLQQYIDDIYYEKHKITHHITPKETSNLFHSKVRLEYVIINENQKENIFRFALQLYKEREDLTLEECFNHFKINCFKINGQDIDVKDYCNITCVEHNYESRYFDYKIVMQYTLERTCKRVKIEAEYEYDSPIFDISHSFHFTRPCKQAEHKYYINEDESTQKKWFLHTQAFSTFYHKQTDENSNFKVEANSDSSVTVQYTKWALVGNGYMLVFQPKTIELKECVDNLKST